MIKHNKISIDKHQIDNLESDIRIQSKIENLPKKNVVFLFFFEVYIVSCSSSPPGGNQVDGLPTVLNTSKGGRGKEFFHNKSVLTRRAALGR